MYLYIRTYIVVKYEIHDHEVLMFDFNLLHEGKLHIYIYTQPQGCGRASKKQVRRVSIPVNAQSLSFTLTLRRVAS